ncbi:hypothetical protein K445DRAFT_20383 [Daldinia sp. EC12]|nr:hypothetical protein F4774DRAFT_410390 [Daldinia eschscholtzii]OTB17916.1 hypothetical protein K445DRAFT_20383 [Daldinia sp. EC12]
MPSGRWSDRQAEYAMYFFYCVFIAVSWQIGGLRSSLFLILLGYWYNNNRGSDANAFVRNLINAMGFTCFGTGALEIALRRRLNYLPALGEELITRSLVKWVIIVAAVVFSTVQTQDMPDQEGDAQRGRKSLPLQVGDLPARWITTIMMVYFGAFFALYTGGGEPWDMLLARCWP